MKYRQANISDVEQLRTLALKSWAQFETALTPENWQRLYGNLDNPNTYVDLLNNSYALVCENNYNKIVGMSFLVPGGNPTEIYLSEWCYIRFVSVDPDYGGQGIGRSLTEQCIEVAKRNSEATIALHTSEMMNKARHIYESLGFTILREIEPRLGKKYWLYTLDLK
jgi:ribosomal protein S18 acetylase RimI-like enzyme